MDSPEKAVGLHWCKLLENRMKEDMKERLEVAGWILFLICAPLFLVSGLVNGDMWTVAASIVLGVGVVLFLIAVRPGRHQQE